MRRSLVKVTNPSIGNATINSLISSSSTFSTSAGGGEGGGRGRGRGTPFSGVPIQSANPTATGSAQEDGDGGARGESHSPLPSGLGHGHGKPFPSAPTLPSFSSFIPFLSTDKSIGRGGVGKGPVPPQAGAGRGGVPFPPHSGSSRGTAPVPPQFGAGRGGAPSPPQSAAGRGSGLAPVPPQFGAGRGGVPAPPQSDHPQGNQQSGAKTPIFFSKRDEMAGTTTTPRSQIGDPGENRQVSAHTHDVLPVFHGAGRGKPGQQPISQEPARVENRHLRPRTPDREKNVGARKPTEKWTAEEATNRDVGTLSKGREAAEDRRGGGRAEYGGRTGGRGLNRGRGRGRGGRFGRVTNRDRGKEESDIGTGLFLGQNADGEKLAERLGAENMNKLVEAFEDMSGRILPSPMEDAYVDALQTNLAIECEPEYLMEEFGTNPDVEEKPTISLQDALEKAKPFFMAYEGLKSQEEWEEAVKEAMGSVPLMKEIVDYYSGTGRVTAKKQQEELELVAQTLPQSAPASVKRFTDRALLSLQSNPGWGYNKKYQFMDKLVKEVSKQYK